MTLEEIAFFCQSCASKSPAIVLGSGASIPYGIKGMTELANWLVAEVTPQCEPETDAWTLVRTALATWNKRWKTKRYQKLWLYKLFDGHGISFRWTIIYYSNPPLAVTPSFLCKNCLPVYLEAPKKISM